MSRLAYRLTAAAFAVGIAALPITIDFDGPHLASSWARSCRSLTSWSKTPPAYLQRSCFKTYCAEPCITPTIRDINLKSEWACERWVCGARFPRGTIEIKRQIPNLQQKRAF
jgi:hypothetical protein